MSRGQQGDVIDTASGENKNYNALANTSFGKTQGDINNYADTVSAFKANNPYVQGGQAETAENQQIADTADAGARSAGQAIQSAAVRTGQNPAGAIAATEQMQQENERALTGQEAAATDKRLAAGAGYADTAMNATGNIAQAQDTLGNQEGALAQGALGTQEQAAQTPSFMDQLGTGLIQAGVSAAGAYGKAKGCWIAAELWGGWEDPRTITVRRWLFLDFQNSWYGSLILRAYVRWGEGIARAIKTRRRLRWLFQLLFNKALKIATEWQVKRGK